MAEPHQGKKNSSFQDEPIRDKMDFTFDPGTKRQAKVFDSNKLYKNFDLNSSLTARERNSENEQESCKGVISEESCKEVVSDRAGFQGLIELGTYDQGDSINGSASKFETSGSLKLPPGSKGLIGTTIIAVVGKKGTFIASDGKTSSNEESTKGLVYAWDHPKIVSITEYIMATISGGVIESERMIETVRKEVEQLSSKVNMKVVRKGFRKYMDIWKKKDANRDKEFPGVVLVYGYRKRKAYIYSVATDEYLKSDTGVFGIGSGYKKAKKYIEEKLKKHNGEPTANDYIEWLNMAVAIAALRDPLSGGYVNMAVVWKSKKKMKKMKKRGGHITRGDHVLQILGRDFDKLERYMEKVFMVVTYGMNYSIFNESQFKKAILDNMEGVETAHLLAIGECSAENPDTIITRVVVFDSADARSSSQFQPGDGVLVFSDDNYDCELFMPTSDRIANLCNFLPSVE